MTLAQVRSATRAVARSGAGKSAVWVWAKSEAEMNPTNASSRDEKEEKENMFFSRMAVTLLWGAVDKQRQILLLTVLNSDSYVEPE
jgi:hypothetical protein